jgi:hypothetical protein
MEYYSPWLAAYSTLLAVAVVIWVRPGAVTAAARASHHAHCCLLGIVQLRRASSWGVCRTILTMVTIAHIAHIAVQAQVVPMSPKSKENVEYCSPGPAAYCTMCAAAALIWVRPDAATAAAWAPH